METEKKSNGALIGSLIIIIILIIGGIYFWVSKIKPVVVEPNTADEKSAAAKKAYNDLGTIEKDVISSDPVVNTEISVDTLE